MLVILSIEDALKNLVCTMRRAGIKPCVRYKLKKYPLCCYREVESCCSQRNTLCMYFDDIASDVVDICMKTMQEKNKMAAYIYNPLIPLKVASVSAITTQKLCTGITEHDSSAVFAMHVAPSCGRFSHHS